jgi:hypothetical protein
VFCFGVHAESGDLTDFGGGISYHRRDNPISGALREFGEESLGVFGFYNEESVKDCPVLYDEKNLIIFIPVTVDIQAITNRFAGLADRCERPEVRSIRWLSVKELNRILGSRAHHSLGDVCRYAPLFDLEFRQTQSEPESSSPTMYSVTRSFLQGVESISDVITLP